jgi:hypothetical protein
MKLNLILVLGVLSLSGSAKAEVSCEAVKRTEGAQVIRGVKIRDEVVKFEETTWFGADSATRDRAVKACWEVVNSTSCSGTTPHASDRYMNVGDPGFGPRLYVAKSTRAGILSLQWTPSDVLKYYPSDYSRLHGKYFAFYSDCQVARSELADEVVGNYQREFLRIAREKFLKEHPQLGEGSEWRYVP